MGKVSKEQAEKEVNQWLDNLCVSEIQKNNQAGSVNKIIDAVVDGTVVIDTETFVLTQNLKKPIGKEVQINSLVFQPDVVVGDIQKHLQDSAPGDRYATVFAHISASTGEPKAIISKLHLKDYNLADSIIVFFML